MGKFYESIPLNLYKWVESQHMFWVASAPLSGDGHVNVSPKGLKGTFHIVNEKQVWYEDMSGSGSETMAHLREPGNGRFTILFCAFEGPPRIMRLFGHGRVIEFGTPGYDELLPPDVRHPGSRCAVMIDIHKVGTSCGFSVPLYGFLAHRPILYNWLAGLEATEREFAARSIVDSTAESRIAEKGLKAYWIKENLKSIDGLPAMKVAYTTSTTLAHALPRGEWGVEEAKVLGSSSTLARNGLNGVANGTGASVQMKELRSIIGGLDSTVLTWEVVVAFSLGVVLTAVYMRAVGGPC